MEGLRRRLLCHPLAAREARDMVRDVLPRDARRDSELASLILTELVSNAVRHDCREGGEIEVELSSEANRLRMKVVQPGPVFDPAAVIERLPGKDRGWGILLIEQLASSWGVEDSAVWVEIELTGN